MSRYHYELNWNIFKLTNNLCWKLSNTNSNINKGQNINGKTKKIKYVKHNSCIWKVGELCKIYPQYASPGYKWFFGLFGSHSFTSSQYGRATSFLVLETIF